MRTAQIGELTGPVKTWNPSRTPEAEFDYIDLSAVDNIRKVITTTTRTIGADAPSRARQLVTAGDVLVSTVRPNLNAVAVVPPELDGATASTGFTVLRPAAQLNGRYLFHWLRSPTFVADMARKATGASYPAVSDRIIKESTLPAPSLDKQHRIAAILDHADTLRVERRRALAHLDALPQAIFHRMFGDPDDATAAVPFGDIATLSGGRNLVADDSSADSAYRVLKISAVTTGQFRPEESKPLPSDYTPPTTHLVRQGDLLMSRANTAELVGAVAYVHSTPDSLALPDKVWRFAWRDPHSSPLFYQALMQTPTIRRRISRLASGTGGSMKNISKAKLDQMPVPHVEICRQQEFARLVCDVKQRRAKTVAAVATHDALFASLQTRAFKGEL